MSSHQVSVAPGFQADDIIPSLEMYFSSLILSVDKAGFNF